MSGLDWGVLILTVFTIVTYGILKFRKARTLKTYYRADQTDTKLTIGLSVMATQASAITFLSTPGQGYASGMGFLQFYFGLPIALIVICAFFLPIYMKGDVFTAYETLERKLGLKNRLLTSFLFLLQRGAAAGITILAPSIIMSLVMDWDLNMTILFIGTVVIAYTVSGGSRAVNQTNKLQMLIMFAGLIIAFCIIITKLPADLSLLNSLEIAGLGQKLKIVNFDFDIGDRYNIWSGIAGGFFLALAYFGTDQSQVQRYLSGKSLKEARYGLLFNAIFKIPIQFLILFIGVLVYVFYQFNPSPLHFNKVQVAQVKESQYSNQWFDKEKELQINYEQKKMMLEDFANNKNLKTDEIANLNIEENNIRNQAKNIIGQAIDSGKTNDKDFVFLTFILDHMPSGIVGLLIAVVLFASMSSSSAEINALGTCTMVDFYQRLSTKEITDRKKILMSRFFNLIWGVGSILFAYFFSYAENLIQGVNIIGSLFYGNILGIFLINFMLKNMNKSAVFWSAIITQLIIFVLYFSDLEIGFLWFNFIACILVFGLSVCLSRLATMMTHK